MLTAEIARMSDAERWQHVRAQVRALEADTARLHLEQHGLPVDDMAAYRLAFARELVMTLRLREFTA